MTVSVVTDSAAGLSREEAESLSVTVVPVHVLLGGRDLTEDEVAALLMGGATAGERGTPTTSQPSPADFAEAFGRIVGGGCEALAVLVSAGMSGTMRSAETGAAMARAQTPAARIELVDSRSNSMQEAFAVLAAAEHAAAGADLAACREAAADSIARSRFLFAPEGLDALARGGRIARAAALIGGALRIVPVLTAADGVTGVVGAVRTRRAAMRRIAALMSVDVGRHGLRRAVVQHVGRPEAAEEFAREWIAPIACVDVPVRSVPAVIGVHVGPAIGVAYETEQPLRPTPGG